MIYSQVIRFISCYRISADFRQSLKYALLFGKGKWIKLRIRGRNIILRRDKTDSLVFKNTFLESYHRSPFDLGEAPVIVDLGCNIGLTMVDYEFSYPNAKIIGVEMDQENYFLSQKNMASNPEAIVLHHAIHIIEGFCTYHGNDSRSFQVDSIIEHQTKDGALRQVSCITMKTLISQFNLKSIDLLKVDIEGFEQDLLCDEKAGEWLKKVRIIYVELHVHLRGKSFGEEIRKKLESQNFTVFKAGSQMNAFWCINQNPE